MNRDLSDGQRQLRILHIIDTLGSGGLERRLTDIVRLSDPHLAVHRVVTFFPDGHFGPFVYAKQLQAAGSYVESDNGERTEEPVTNASLPAGESERTSRKSGTRFTQRVKQPLIGVRNRTNWAVSRGAKPLSFYAPPTQRIISAFISFRPDIVHVHGFFGFRYGVWLKKVFRRPFLHTVPCMVAQMEDAGLSWFADYYRRFNREVDRFFLDGAYRQELMSLGVNSEKLVEIKGAVDFRAAQAAAVSRESHRRSVREELGLPATSVVELPVGRMDRTKGNNSDLK